MHDMITIRALNKHFETASGVFDALSDIHLEIESGEIFGIFGQSGAGKSTLLRSINGLVRASSGEISVDGVSLNGLSVKGRRDLRHRVAMIFQHFNLLASRNVFDNVALPLELQGQSKAAAHARVAELLKLVGISDRAKYMPSALSGGQKQRVSIARALATNPKVLLCDEVTSALDPEATRNVLDLLKDINQRLGVTIVLITHELNVIKHICDRAGIIENGRFIEIAETLNLFMDPQHPSTKHLIEKALHFPSIEQLRQAAPKDQGIAYQFVKLTFLGESGDEPLIATLVKRFDIDMNLIHADITHIKQQTVGYTIGILSGEKAKLQLALDYIRQTNVKLEVINHD
jgi:D-methionine transport system ATP-binding protein